MSSVSRTIKSTYPQMGVVGVSWPIKKFWCPHHIFGTGEARYFKFGMQINIDKYQRMYDLYDCRKGLCSGYMTSLILGK